VLSYDGTDSALGNVIPAFAGMTLLVIPSNRVMP